MPFFLLNWLDIAIIAFLVFFAWQAWRVGFWVILTDFLSFIIAFLVALAFYSPVSGLVGRFLSLGRVLGNAISFLAIAVVAEVVVGYLLIYIVRIPPKVKQFRFFKAISIVLSICEVLVLTSFFLTLLLALPVPPNVKASISNSKIGGYLTAQTSRLEDSLSDVFGGVASDSLTHLVVEQGGRESVSLDVHSYDLSTDENSESEMFALINLERKQAGVQELVWDQNLLPIARKYAEDMWRRKYFSHYSPEGTNVGDRLQGNNIDYSVAGENLALAPTLEIAHDGLMNSPGHRANILSQDFIKVGIGVVDNGYYGKIFVQIFIN